MEAHLRRQDAKLEKYSQIFRTTNNLFRRLNKNIKAMRDDARHHSQKTTTQKGQMLLYKIWL